MRSLNITLTLALLANILIASAQGLDKANPITLSDGCVIYSGDTIPLGERTLFVDGSLSDEVVAASPFMFNDFREAMSHLIDGTPEEPMRILLAPWVYWVDNPDEPKVAVGKDGREPFGMTVRCHNLHLIGLNPDAHNVVLASQRGQTQGAVGNFTMFDFHGDGLRVENLTMGNFCNVDLEFPMKPSLSKAKRSPTITQAHVAYVRGDRVVATNVRFISRLNMNPLNGAKRILFDRCHMECTDDALTGNGVYLNCTLDFYGQKPFYSTHRCGAVFLGCQFRAMGSNRHMAFCKAPGAVTLIDCHYSAIDGLYLCWANYPTAWLRCYQSNFLLNDKPYIVGNQRAENTILIDSLPMRRAFNIYNLLSGDDGWNPLNQPSSESLPTALLIDKLKADLRTGDDALILSAEAKRHGGYSYTLNDNERIVWTIEKGFEKYVEIVPQGDNTCLVRATNNTDETAVFSVIAHLIDAQSGERYGLEAAVELTVRPSLLPAPAFTIAPTLNKVGNELRLDYDLDLEGRADRSEITWYRATDASGNGAIPVMVSRGGVPERTYRLSPNDDGYHIMARIMPRHLRSVETEPTMVITSEPVKTADIPMESLINTDFRTFPTDNQPHLIPGFWTVDGNKPADTADFPWEFDLSKPMWHYGEGFNGAVGEGLLQAQRGARLLFTPLEADYGDMELTLLVDPTKTAGQGFGSATGQYMDVMIKMNTSTLTGYALRIIRTVKHAKAVDFLLMEYRNGEARPISAPISSTCYRTGCTISLSAIGNRLTAHVETATPAPSPSDNNPSVLPLPHSVDLEAKITPNTFGGMGIQHTGSCGESTTMLHRLTVKAK